MMTDFMQKPRQGYGSMVMDQLVHRLREMNKEREGRIQEALKSRKKAEAYRDEVKSKIERIFRPLPRKTALNSQVISVKESKDFRVENVLYYSRPDFPVTANLYIPNVQNPVGLPGVVGSCGHSKVGKAEKNYQAFGAELARAGFIVLIFDPIHQGERRHYGSKAGKPDDLGFPPTHGHNRMARWLELGGDNFGNWRAWDAIRSVDYLLTRPEVDPSRIGMTGNSGGGTMTTWVWPLEDRLRFAAPSCFVTRFLDNLENELPADAEQYPTGVFKEGLEMADFLIARAPDPILMLAQKYCFFDRRGFTDSVSEVKAFYEVLGVPQNAQAVMGVNVHGYYPDTRHAMVKQFSQWAGLRKRAVTISKPFDYEELQVGKKEIIYAELGKDFHETFAPELERQRENRKKLSNEQVQKRLRSLLTLPKSTEVQEAPHYRILHPYTFLKPFFARYAVETEEGIRTILWKARTREFHLRTLDVEKKAILYLPHQSTELEMPALLARGFKAREDTGYYGLDYRGVGQSRYDEIGDFFGIYGFEYMANGHHLMFGESYLGKRVLDVLRTVALLAEEGVKEFSIHGVGIGAIVGLLVASLDGRIKKILYENGPLAYDEFVKDPRVEWPVSCIIHSSNKYLDLPDLYRLLGNRLTIRTPWTTQMKPYTPAALATAAKEYSVRSSQLRTGKSKNLMDIK